MLREALVVHRGLGDRWRVASVLEEIVGSVLMRNDPQRGVEILAATETLRERLGTPIPLAEAAERDASRAGLEGKLNAGRFASSWEVGRLQELDSVVDVAVEALDALEGHTNGEIAAALYISPSTGGVHVSNILRKLGAKRRVDAAGLAPRLGLLAPR